MIVLLICVGVHFLNTTSNIFDDGKLSYKYFDDGVRVCSGCHFVLFPGTLVCYFIIYFDIIKTENVIKCFLTKVNKRLFNKKVH